MKTITKLLACTLIGLFSGLNSAVYAAHGDDVHFDNCKDLPSPVLQFTGTEDYEANGKEWTRYRLEIDNDYPQELFRAAPDLPPCGLNKNSARTWVNIFKGPGDRLNSFCALSEPAHLKSLWFALPRGDIPPKSVYVQFNDRSCNKTHTSNRVSVDEPSIVNVDCDEQQSLNDALNKASPGVTINITGTCQEPTPYVIPKSLRGITVAGSVDGLTTLDGGGKKSPVLTISGAKDITIKGLTLKNSRTAGLLFTDNASGKVQAVNATESAVGFEVTERSKVVFDDSSANNNRKFGFKLSKKARVRFMNLDAPDNQCLKPEVSLPTVKAVPQIITPFKTVLFSLQETVVTASDTVEPIDDPIDDPPEETEIQNCSIVAYSNGEVGPDSERESEHGDEEASGHGILVDGASITGDGGSNGVPTELRIFNCLVTSSDLSETGEMNGIQSTGIEIINGARVTTEGATLITEGNSSEGVYIDGASTLVLSAFPSATEIEDIQSRVESNLNSSGMELDGSSVILNDQSEIKVRNNTENGVFFSYMQLLACDPEAKFIITDNEADDGLNIEIEGDLPNDGRECVLQETEDSPSPSP